MAHIIYAGYGEGNSVVDVTEPVANSYRDGQREFSASNDLGGDPAPGEKKYLFIVWAQQSVLASGLTGEGDERAISVP